MNKYLLMFITFIVIFSIALQGMALAERNVIIGYHQKPDHADENEIKNNGGNIKHSYRNIPAVSAKLSDQAIAKMKSNPRVAYIENDTILKATVDEYNISWGVSHIGSKIVHDNSINGTGVKIAVLDTGIDYNHEDLRDNYKGGFDFVYNSSNPFDDSYNSHGTHVSGIIAAEKNGIGVVGVAPNASLYSVKVLDGAGFGFASWVIAGIDWAVDNKMDIATMSFGSSPYDPDLQSLKIACDNAYNAGVLLVAAAGNTNGGNITYPAGFDSVIAVTATDQNDQKAFFSPIDPKIELAAPGVDIMSTINKDNGYGLLSGTSMSAPHVTGIAALLISSHNLKDLNGDGVVNYKDVRLQLQNTAKDLGDPGKDDTYGYGLVDAQAAVPPPPANQNLGIYDTTVNTFTEPLCRNCHSAGVPDRHHLLTGSPNYEYGCQDCHPVGAGGVGILIDRNCIACHNGSAFYGNPSLIAGRPHHNTTWAQNRACEYCHGSLIDNYADGHYIPTYRPSLVTPDPSFKVKNQTTGKKWGGCEACHEPDASATPPIVMNTDTHHNEVVGKTSGLSCLWCHNTTEGAINIRSCEQCHGVKSLHNIQYNYSSTQGQLGYGHLGANWDCNGCHAWYVAGGASLLGAIIPQIDTITPAELTANVATDVTITGSNLIQDTYTTAVVVDGVRYSPTSLTDITLSVNLPALTAGVHEIKVVKGDASSKLASLTVVSPVKITNATLRSGTITIIGSGFGTHADPFYVTIEHGVTIYKADSITRWTDTKIVARSLKAAVGDTVTVTIATGSDSATIKRR